MQSPESSAATVFVDRLHVHVPHSLQCRGADDFREKGFGGFVPVEDAVLAAFLVIDHELHCDPGVSGPLRVWGLSAITDHVAGVINHPKL